MLCSAWRLVLPFLALAVAHPRTSFADHLVSQFELSHFEIEVHARCWLRGRRTPSQFRHLRVRRLISSRLSVFLCKRGNCSAISSVGATMARLASSPWPSCGPTRLDRCGYQNFRGCTRDGCHIATSSLTSSFLAVCEVRPSLGSRKSSRSRLQFVETQERVGVIAGLIEETAEGRGGGPTDDLYLEALLPEVKVDLNVTNLGNNTRRVEAGIAIQAPLEAVWGVLTDYNHLADHIPGLAESRVLELRSNGARLLQVGQKNFALGVKFKAKAVVEVTEEALQNQHDGTLRDLHFDNVEGDFQVFKGTWRMHQKSASSNVGTKNRIETYLSYILEVQPKRWMPVALIEGILGHEITCNLVSVRNVALRNHHSL